MSYALQAIGFIYLYLFLVLLGFQNLSREKFTSFRKSDRPQKFHEYIGWWPIIGFANPFCYVLIDEDDAVFHRRYGRDVTSRLAIHAITATFRPTGLLGSVFGYGTVNLSVEGNKHEVRKLQSANKLINEISYSQLPANNRTDFHIAGQCRHAIPYALLDILVAALIITASAYAVSFVGLPDASSVEKYPGVAWFYLVVFLGVLIGLWSLFRAIGRFAAWTRYCG
jgi:hypothetical protein